MKMSNKTFIDIDIDEDLLKILKKNIFIIAYILQILFVLMYTDPELQPFVYVLF